MDVEDVFDPQGFIFKAREIELITNYFTGMFGARSLRSVRRLTVAERNHNGAELWHRDTSL